MSTCNHSKLAKEHGFFFDYQFDYEIAWSFYPVEPSYEASFKTF